jgi:hypothetical protein
MAAMEEGSDSLSSCVLRDIVQVHFPHNCAEIIRMLLDMSAVKVDAAEKTYPVMASLVAFGDLEKRSLFNLCLSRALQPTVVHSAYIKDLQTREFEVVLLSRKKIDILEVETFLELFNMSVCVIPFSRYMGPDMMEGISRIQKGNHPAGNFQTPLARTVRRYYQAKKRSKHIEDKKAQVQRITGLSCGFGDVYVWALYACCLLFLGSDLWVMTQVCRLPQKTCWS